MLLSHFADKSSYLLGSELWGSKLDGLLGLVKEYILYKEYIVDVWGMNIG